MSTPPIPFPDTPQTQMITESFGLNNTRTIDNSSKHDDDK